jgi:NAD+ synthase (glutamine-hydrolysing)
MERLRVAGAQLDLRVGDITGNTARIIEAMDWAEEHGADVLALPELAVTGYPPEDLLLKPGFIRDNLAAVDEIAAASRHTVTIFGFVDQIAVDTDPDDSVDRRLANAAAIVSDGQVRGTYHKVLLPNYAVFDEARYFVRGTDPDRVWRIGDAVVGISICEDIWSTSGPPSAQAAAGAQVLININGSPYDVGKAQERAEIVAAEATRSAVPVVYVNTVGGQDELVFDGQSMVHLAGGELLARSPRFEEDLFVVDVPLPEGRGGNRHAIVGAGHPERGRPIPQPKRAGLLEGPAEIYTALVTGLRDYVRKNGFSTVVIGLSGGIDSALTCAIAVDALGPESVHGVTMPTRYSSEGSVTDSKDLAARLGCRISTVPIDDVFTEYLEALAPEFAGAEPGVAEENLQARIRGAILMALSNKFGGMVVATGNKSEMAVGYATLYGDMAGGYAVLKDVYKTTVYALARWRNRDGVVIPTSIIEKPPSAELRPDQLDTDSLPEYEVLDAILRGYIEGDESQAGLVAAGFDEELVARIVRLVDRNEYKRRQAAPGVRISRKAFGKDRRLPISNGYRG